MPTIRVDDEVFDELLSLKHLAEKLFGQACSMNEAVEYALAAAGATQFVTIEERARVKGVADLAHGLRGAYTGLAPKT